MLKKPNGFTIVELLIVIVVIAILAALSLVAYNGVQDRANDVSVQSDLNKLGKAFLRYQVENGVLPKGPSQLNTMATRISKNAYGNHLLSGGNYYNLLYCWPTSAEPTRFALVAASKSGSVFQYVNGTVSQASYAFNGSSSNLCNSAGSPIDSSSSRDWYYNVNAWASYAND